MNVTIHLGIGYPTAEQECDIDELGIEIDEWEAMTEDERYEQIRFWAADHIEYWWEKHE